ncbi:protein ACCELERATED CELL DEATH 6-like [Neltuma alba]|uniref:protein ACCELERATED CELL DEATH 6-like n=1 Tax=Neltuma alba TaxID=207710 RepID=UPI0010A2CC71|nr:protein ACCELERATED CELL DEATH 6-like [Prosopis alba]
MRQKRNRTPESNKPYGLYGRRVNSAERTDCTDAAGKSMNSAAVSQLAAMGDSSSGEITLVVATDGSMPNQMMGDISEQRVETKRQSDYVQFPGNEKMHELMKRQLSSSIEDDIPFHANKGHVMCFELYEVASDENADADRFVYVLEQLCEENKVGLATIFDHVTTTCDSLLHVAAQHGSKQVLRLITFHYPKLLYQTNMKGDTPLHVAARAKNLVGIKNILAMEKHFMLTSDDDEEEEAVSMDKAEFIMLRNNYGMTALREAVLSKNSSVVRFLLSAHKQSNLTTWNYAYGCKSPMYLAALTSVRDVLCSLLDIPIPSGKDISNGDSPLHATISERDTCQNVLHIAAMKGQTNMLRHLLKHPKIHHDIVNERDVNGNTPLHLASRGLRLWTLLLLSQHKMFDVNIMSNEGFTARDVVRMKCKHPMTCQEFLADAILENVGVSLKANMLAIQCITSTNKEWNVKDAANTLILVTILIAIVTFTAGFTVPGGFYSSDGPIPKQRGLALLADQTLFKIFMAFNAIAMYSSTIGSVILLWVPLGDLRFAGVYGLAKIFVYVALIAMPVAFLAAIRLIVSKNTLLADFISVNGFISIFFIIFVCVLEFFPLRNRRPVFRQIAGLFIRIIIILFYGGSDVVDRAVGKVDAARSEIDSDGSGYTSRSSFPSDHPVMLTRF